MKCTLKFMTGLLAISTACVSSAAQEATDTIKVIEKANKTIVTRSGNTTKIVADIGDTVNSGQYYIYEIEVSRLDGDQETELKDPWDMRIPFFYPRNPETESGSRHTIKRKVTALKHIYWGWRFNYHDKVHVKNSFETGIRHMVGVTWNRGRKTPSFSIGAGFGFMRLNAQDGYIYEKLSDCITFDAVTSEIKIDKSHLDIWRLHMPVMMTIPLGRAGNFCFGGVANFNTYASAVTQIYYGDVRKKTKYKSLQQNLLTADLYASISIGGVGIYATWEPTSLFNKPYGPQLKSWSIGIDMFCF